MKTPIYFKLADKLESLMERKVLWKTTGISILSVPFSLWKISLTVDSLGL